MHGEVFFIPFKALSFLMWEKAQQTQSKPGLGTVPNIYISNLPLAAVTMATRSPSNRQQNVNTGPFLC